MQQGKMLLALALFATSAWAQAEDPGLTQLRAAVVEAQKSSADPLSEALARFALPEPEFVDVAFTPDKQLQKPEDVTDEEWRDLLALKPQADAQEALSLGEREGIGSYVFFDVDGDGLRDLLLRTVEGGTLQCASTYVLRRTSAGIQPEQSDSYDICQVGGPQFLWLRIGQTRYVAQRQDALAGDTLNLQRPFSQEGGTLSVRYRYTLAAHARVSRSLQQAINQALAKAPPKDDPQDSPCFENAETAVNGRFGDFGSFCAAVFNDRMLFPVQTARGCQPGALTDVGRTDPKTGQMDAYISVGDTDLVTEEQNSDCYAAPEKVITGVRIVRHVESIK